ncbi:MAG: hypothetical protein HGB14_10605 [Anaerolineaceae bacterium]|nr:hypothetical protein [Anaerolineaceae bacterium]
MSAKFRLIPLLFKFGIVIVSFFLLSFLITPKEEIGKSPKDSLGMGTSTHLRVGIDELGDAYQQLEEMNIHWVREEFPWSEIEQSPGEYVFSYDFEQTYRDFDSMVALAKRHGLEVVAVLNSGPAYLYHNYPDQPVDGDDLLQSWEGFVQAIVDRYGDDIDYWEIGSEPNNPQQWGKVMFPTVADAISSPSPFLYAQMLSTAEKIIKKHNNRDMIILGGLYNSSNSDCTTNPVAYLADLVNAGVWDSFDIVAIHPYWQNNPPEVWMQRGPSTDIKTGECFSDIENQTNLIGEIRYINEFIQEYGTKKIWITEIGWNEDWLNLIGSQNGFDPDQIESNFLVRSIIQLITEEQVDKVFWYTLFDDPSNPGFSLSIQSMATLKNISLLLSNARPLGQFQKYSDLGSPDELGLFEYRFRKEGRTIIYAWAANGGATPYPITMENVTGVKYRAYPIDTTDLSLDNGMELDVADDHSLTIYVNEIPAILIEEKPNMIASLIFRIEDSVSRWYENQKENANDWVNQQKQKMINKELDWAEESLLNLLNKIVDKLSGG